MNNEPFEAAVTRHGARVLRVCRAVLGAGPDADDAWSETFLAALRAWPDLDPDTNVEAWLVRVAGRKAIDITRSRSRRGIPLAAVGEPDGTDPLWTQSPTTRHTEIWDEVAELPQRQRLAIAYHYFGGLPHAETAQLTGSTPAAVRRAAADGIKALRQRRTGVEPDTSTRPERKGEPR